MASSNVKNPPVFDSNTTYENWEKSLKIWQLVTDLPPEKQGPALVLALKGKAREAVLELSIDDIKSKEGIDNILIKLSKIYKKDTLDASYEAFEKFIFFKRDDSMSITSFVNEFERRHNLAKTHGCEISSNILAFFLLNQANLSEEHKKLVKATISQLEFEDMKTKLLKVFGSPVNNDCVDEIKVKVEDINFGEEKEEAFYGDRYSRYAKNYRSQRVATLLLPEKIRITEIMEMHNNMQDICQIGEVLREADQITNQLNIQIIEETRE